MDAAATVPLALGKVDSGKDDFLRKGQMNAIGRGFGSVLGSGDYSITGSACQLFLSATVWNAARAAYRSERQPITGRGYGTRTVGMLETLTRVFLGT